MKPEIYTAVDNNTLIKPVLHLVDLKCKKNIFNENSFGEKMQMIYL
jgi:hypothetical protein